MSADLNATGSGQVVSVCTGDLKLSVRRLLRLNRKSEHPVRLTFCDGLLTITWGEHEEQIAAQGRWPQEVLVPAKWVRALGINMPKADPIELRVVQDRLIADQLSCNTLPEAHILQRAHDILPHERTMRLTKAVRALRKLRVSQNELEALITKCESETRKRYSAEDDLLLQMVADAWVPLAVFGVRLEDVYLLAQASLRSSWIKGPLFDSPGSDT